MIIGITGLAGAGKDTVANYLVDTYGFERRAFADKLKEFALDINPILKEHVKVLGWEDAKKLPENRRFLQNVGNEARNHFGDTFWIDQILSTNLAYPERLVISDVRYENEFSRIRFLKGIIIRVNRPGLEPVNNHITEVGHLDFEVDFTIYNSTFDDLYRQVDKMVYELDVL